MAEKTATEEWRDIPGYVGYYQASNLGRIRSLVRLIQSKIDAGVRKEKRVLSPGHNLQGRCQVSLCRDGMVRRKQVHRLVLEAFVGPCPVGMEACHGPDNDHRNNRLDNLRWDTKKANFGDAVALGTMGKPKKLTQEQVDVIRAAEGTQRSIAAQFGVSQVMVHNIRHGKVWKKRRL